jgi:hypothetical protein
MAFTIDQYTKLCEAIALGATSVKYADKEVQYRSLAEMRSLKSEMEAELFPVEAQKKTINRRRYVEYDRGI